MMAFFFIWDYLARYIEALDAKRKALQSMLISRRSISTMLIIIQVSCFWNA